jgi:LPXTG-motif cell wall-anchored protein
MRKVQMIACVALACACVALFAGAASAAAPSARNDAVKTAVNKKVTFGVLANDSASAGDQIDPTSLNIDTFPNFGDVELSLDGKFTYTPPSGFQGVDTFTYVVCSATNLNQCSTATVRVTVGNPAATTTTTAPPPVTASPASPPPPPTVAVEATDANALPRTGSPSAGLLALGVALCAAGASLLGASKRRERAVTR